MHILSSFKYTSDAEMAIKTLLRAGIEQTRIAAVPMDEIPEVSPRDQAKRVLYEGRSFDLAFLVGTVFSVIGASVGFRLTWGPIVWGIIGLALGAAAGLLISLLLGLLLGSRPQKPDPEAELLLLIVRCEESELHRITDILRSYAAWNIGRLD